jgi:hypothetical protein
MRRIRIAVLLAIAAFVLLACTSAPTAFSRWGYRTYPTCNVFDHPPHADSTCSFGDGFGAVLISKHRQRIHYRLCVRAPSGKHWCVRKRAREGKPSRVGLFGRRADRERPGKWTLEWKHGGHRIDRDHLHVASEGV